MGRLDVLAALAASTERVRLGPLVASTAFHPPGLVARMAATIDEVSGGRFVLGARRGLERDGVPRLRHPVRQQGRAVRGGVHDHPPLARRRARDVRGPLPLGRGRVLLPRPQRRVPLMVGTRARASCRHRGAARRLVELLVLVYGNTPSGFAELSATVRRRLSSGSACVLVAVDGVARASGRFGRSAARPGALASISIGAAPRPSAHRAFDPSVLDPIDGGRVAAVADCARVALAVSKSARVRSGHGADADQSRRSAQRGPEAHTSLGAPPRRRSSEQRIAQHRGDSSTPTQRTSSRSLT